METYTLRLTNKLSELDKIRDTLEELAAKWAIPPETGISVNLALEEAFTNIVNYGYNDNTDHEIEMVFTFDYDQLTISITDDATPYDPTRQPDPDIELSAPERPVGGLGVFLIKKIMDDVQYARNNDKNILTLKKKLNQ